MKYACADCRKKFRNESALNMHYVTDSGKGRERTVFGFGGGNVPPDLNKGDYRWICKKRQAKSAS
jgi:hypothetical protein